MEKFCVVGFGVSGKALCDTLLKLGITPAVLEKDRSKWDNKYAEKGVEFFERKEDVKRKFQDVKFILSSSVKHDEFLDEKFVSELDFVLEKIGSKSIVITGTKGKGSTVYFSYLLLKEAGFEPAVGGNMGWDFPVESKPASLLILDKKDLFLIEASSFQLRATFKNHPHIFAVTMITEDHLDWHPSEDDYRISKLKMAFISPKVVISWYALDHFFSVFTPPLYLGLDVLVTLNTEKPSLNFVKESVKKIAEFRKMKSVSFLWNEGDRIYYESSDTIQSFDFPKDKFSSKFLGEHWTDNLLVAFGITLLWCEKEGREIPKDILKRFVEKVQPQKYSMQNEGVFLYDGKKVKVINDSKATNPIALSRALSSFEKEVILICGGKEEDMKGIDWHPYRFQLAKKTKFAIILSNEKLKRYFFESTVEEDLESAVRKAFEVAQDGDIILFSPGCASTSTFRSAKERGEIFSAIVRKIAKKLDSSE